LTGLALDTSAAVALLVATHPAHGLLRSRLAGVEPVLTGHSLAETYAVLTRLPADARVAPADAATLLSTGFGKVAVLSARRVATIPSQLAAAGIAGGAVYDALVALAAAEHGHTLLSRDARAASTYRTLGVDHAVLG
jgi:predicted nucleic acid-binding protein